ncbi:DinB family protein [Marivirga arenosa]|uniref:DinB family protein n=1 Tax=Marivirga arenosa TaxID=3059076 RepID=A0AA51ZUN2_9BACT|nr:DinB family protein [Marivirga sp. BKB1-2]WNB16768.1 DinB family protein [Marivirga sp. BKB1-2]
MQVIDNHKAIRNNFDKALANIEAELLVKIPEGFNNNILWNFGHVVATQNVLIYGMSGLDFTVPTDFLKQYKKGSFPQTIENPLAELEAIKIIAENANKQLIEDIKEVKFNDYQAYETSFGVVLESFNDALQFNNIHESMHLGIIKTMKQCLIRK